MRRILILRKMLPSIRTLQPQLLAIIKPQPRNRYHNDTQKRQQTTRPLIPQLIIHLVGKQREASSYKIANENYTGECGCRVGLVGVDDVVEDAEDDDVDA